MFQPSLQRNAVESILNQQIFHFTSVPESLKVLYLSVFERTSIYPISPANCDLLCTVNTRQTFN